MLPFTLQSIKDYKTDAWLKYGSKPGVYFLIHEKKIVYIGQSNTVLGRAFCHDDKQYDDIFYISTDGNDNIKKQLDIYEGAFIRYFRPKYNGQSSMGRMVAPATHIFDNEVCRGYGLKQVSDIQFYGVV